MKTRINILQLLIPFVDNYRPFWVGLGILSFYIFLIVTVTFYLRAQIGTKTFRAIHLISLAGYLGVTVHGLFAGTDSALPVTMFLYAGTFLVIVFLTAYWLIMRKSEKVEVMIWTPQKATQKNIINKDDVLHLQAYNIYVAITNWLWQNFIIIIQLKNRKCRIPIPEFILKKIYVSISSRCLHQWWVYA